MSHLQRMRQKCTIGHKILVFFSHCGLGSNSCGREDLKIDAFRLRHLAECVENQSQNPEVLDEVLRRVGLSRKAIESPKSIETIVELRFVNEACYVLDDPAFGARAGLQFRDGTNLTSYIAKYSPNLRAAIDNSARYYSLFDPAFSYSLRVSGNAASFSFSCKDPTVSQFYQYKEFLLFAALARGRSLTGKNYYPLEMRFDHEAKSEAKEIRKLAGCPVVFGAENIEIIQSLTTLDLPIPTYDPNLQKHLIEYGERLLEDLPEHNPSLQIQVKGILVNSLPGRIPAADDVALSLGMSNRNLARKLAEEGTSFQKIVDEVRCDLAKAYLKDSVSISEIAFSLAYSDQAAFSTAFRRWMGCSPRDYRTSLILKEL